MQINNDERLMMQKQQVYCTLYICCNNDDYDPTYVMNCQEAEL